MTARRYVQVISREEYRLDHVKSQIDGETQQAIVNKRFSKRTGLAYYFAKVAILELRENFRENARFAAGVLLFKKGNPPLSH